MNCVDDIGRIIPYAQVVVTNLTEVDNGLRVTGARLRHLGEDVQDIQVLIARMLLVPDRRPDGRLQRVQRVLAGTSRNDRGRYRAVIAETETTSDIIPVSVSGVAGTGVVMTAENAAAVIGDVHRDVTSVLTGLLHLMLALKLTSRRAGGEIHVVGVVTVYLDFGLQPHPQKVDHEAPSGLTSLVAPIDHTSHTPVVLVIVPGVTDFDAHPRRGGRRRGGTQRHTFTRLNGSVGVERAGTVHIRVWKRIVHRLLQPRVNHSR